MLLRLAKLCKLISIFWIQWQQHIFKRSGAETLLPFWGSEYHRHPIFISVNATYATDFSRFAQYLMVSCNVVCQISRVLKHKIVDDNFVKFPQFVVTGFYRLKNLCPSLFLRNCVSRILFLYPNVLRDCCQLTWCNMFLQMFLVTLSFPAFCWPHPNFWTCVTVMKLRMNKYFTCTL